MSHTNTADMLRSEGKPLLIPFVACIRAVEPVEKGFCNSSIFEETLWAPSSSIQSAPLLSNQHTSHKPAYTEWNSNMPEQKMQR